jgi:hypothetical protein
VADTVAALGTMLQNASALVGDLAAGGLFDRL